MVAMEEFCLQVMSPFYHRPATVTPCSIILFENNDIHIDRCYHFSRVDTVDRELD